MGDARRTTLTRREFVCGALLTAGAYILTPLPNLFADEEKKSGKEETGVVPTWRAAAATAKVESKAVRGPVHVLTGSGGNIGVLVSGEGLLLVDSGLAGSRPQIAKALSGISEKKIKYVVSTHWHFDHCDGNAWMRSEGATLIAHRNTKKHLAEATHVPDWEYTFEAVPESDLPSSVVEDRMKLELKDAAAAVNYYGFTCHTDGDLYVNFENADVVHCGDTFWNGHYPFIDRANGGSIDGMIRATEANLKLIGPKTILIPGHGALAGKDELEEFGEMLAGVREAVAKLKKEGKTIEEAVAAKPTAKWDAKYGGFAIKPEHFTQIVYTGV